MKLSDANRSSLLSAQQAETMLGKHRAELTALSAQPEIAELERRRIERRGNIQSTTGQLDLASAEIKRLESDIDVVKKRIQRDHALLPTMANPKDIAGLEHELATLAQRLDELETQELEALENRDELTDGLQQQESELASIQAAIADLESRRAQRASELKSQMLAEQQQLSAALGALPDELSVLLQQLWSRGSGVGELRDTTCGVCHMGLNASAMAEIKKTPKDEVVQCPECRAILLEPRED